MTDILKHSNEYETAHLLGGYPDSSNGQALRYFAGLNDEDRENIQWYAEQGILPELTLGSYVHHLITGYQRYDPERRMAGAKAEATREMQRLDRYLELYLGCEVVFPELAMQQEIVPDEDGKWDTIEYLVWHTQDMQLFRMTQEAVRKGLFPLFKAAQLAVDDASKFPAYMELCGNTDWNV